MMTNTRRQIVRGVTLVELLIVISIMVILAAIALPSFKSTIHERKPSQAALIVKSFFEAARARSIGRQREVAVVVERLAGDSVQTVDSNVAFRMSLAEVLPPYRGDLDTSTTELLVPAAGLPVTQATFDFTPNPSARYFLNVGDLIAFDDRPERFEIVGRNPVTIDMSVTSATITFANTPKWLWNGTSYQSVHSLPDRPIVNFVPGTHQFRIYSKPRRLFSKPVVLPKGSCIDLSLSGSGRSATEFNAIPPSSGSTNTTPLYFVFSPNGGVSSVFFGINGPASRFLPTEDIYLFVGRSEQVVERRPGGNPDGAVSDRDSFRPNLNDSSCFWLRINPDSGQISTSSNSDPVTHGVTGIAEQIMHAREMATSGLDSSAQ